MTQPAAAPSKTGIFALKSNSFFIFPAWKRGSSECQLGLRSGIKPGSGCASSWQRSPPPPPPLFPSADVDHGQDILLKFWMSLAQVWSWGGREGEFRRKENQNHRIIVPVLLCSKGTRTGGAWSHPLFPSRDMGTRRIFIPRVTSQAPSRSACYFFSNSISKNPGNLTVFGL